MQSENRNDGSSRTTYLFVPSDHLKHLSELFRVFANTLGRRGAARHLQWGGGEAHHPEVCAP